jgi:hypothetical protein
MKQSMRWGIGGGLSGAFTAVLLQAAEDFDSGAFAFPPVMWLAGILFGGAVAVLLRWQGTLRIIRLALWMICSAAAYTAAVFAALSMAVNGDESSQAAFFVGGLVGSLLVFAAVHFVLFRLSGYHYLILVAAGSLLGVLVAALFHDPLTLLPLSLLYIVWQGVMAGMLGYVHLKATELQSIR